MDITREVGINLIILFVLIVLSGIFSASETALTSFRSIYLEELEKGHQKEAILLKKWLRYPNEILTGMLLGNNIVNILSSSIATALTFSLIGNNSTSIAISTTVMTIVLLVFGEITPKVIAKNNSIKVSTWVIWPMTMLAKITRPIILILMGLSKFIGRLFGIEIKDEALMITEKDIISFVNVGEAEGIIEEGEKEMIHSIFEFGETTAKEVMTPRTAVFSLEGNKSIDEVWTELVDNGYSRIPIYEETIDNVIGILYVKDILNAIKEGKVDSPIKEFTRKPYFVPETKSIIEILQEFRVTKVHIAVVVDEYGGVVGLVTIEDLIEEIVGEIRDEFDHEEEDFIIKQELPNTYMIDAMIDIETLNKELELYLPTSDDYESLAGLIMSEISKLAVVGDSIKVRNCRLDVVELDKMRISKVLLTIEEEDHDEENE